MTDPVAEVVERLREAAREIRHDGTPSQVGLTEDECLAFADILERLSRERDTGVPEGIPEEPVRVRLDSSELKFGECDFCYQRSNLGRDARGDLMCGSCADANYLGEMTAYARQLRAMLSAAPQPPTVSPDIDALTRERDQAREALEPFSRMADSYDEDRASLVVASKLGTIICVYDLRRARSVLHPEKEEKA